jgi:anti-sigma B factor antagonist
VQLLQIDVIPAGERVVIQPAGDLDLGTAKRFEDALRLAFDGHRAVIVDLRRVQFLDSEGLNALLRVEHWAGQRGVAFRLVRGPRRVDRLFDLTGTRSRLEFVDLPADLGLEMPQRSVG